jgi:hypothetical protein
LIPQEQFVAIANDIWAAMALIFGQQCHHDPPRLIAAFETYASPTIAKPFGRYRKLLHLKSVVTIVRLTARSAANQTVQPSHRSL